MSREIKKFAIGGIELPGRKELNTDLEIEELPLPEVVYLPVKQHIGRPGEIIVEKGDYVKRGQCIVEEQKGVSARLHASVAGEIIDIKENGHIVLESKYGKRKEYNIKEIEFVN